MFACRDEAAKASEKNERAIFRKPERSTEPRVEQICLEMAEGRPAASCYGFRDGWQVITGAAVR